MGFDSKVEILKNEEKVRHGQIIITGIDLVHGKGPE